METKVCGKCKQEKSISEFYKSNRSGYRSRCKICHKEDCREYSKTGYYSKYHKEYYKRPEVKERVKLYMKGYRKRPDVRIKNLARWWVYNERTEGRLTREPCAFCGAKQVEAHHTDYHHPLMIVWLCADCHRKLHPKQPTLKEYDDKIQGDNNS